MAIEVDAQTMEHLPRTMPMFLRRNAAEKGCFLILGCNLYHVAHRVNLGGVAIDAQS